MAWINIGRRSAHPAAPSAGDVYLYQLTGDDQIYLRTSAGTYPCALNIHGLTEKTTLVDADEVVIYDSAGVAIKRATRANLVHGATQLGLAASYDAGNSGATKTISFANGQVQKCAITATCAFTLTLPTRAGHYTLLLYLTYGSATVYTATWTNSISWLGGVAPTLSCATARTDLIAFAYDSRTSSLLGQLGAFWVP